MPVEDPLSTLFADEEDLAREEIAEVLRPLLRFTKDGALILEDGFQRLTTLQQVTAVLLSFKALYLLGVRDAPGATPQEIIDTSGMAPGSVRPKLSELSGRRLVAKQGREYSIPTHAARKAVSILRGGVT